MEIKFGGIYDGAGENHTFAHRGSSRSEVVRSVADLRKPQRAPVTVELDVNVTGKRMLRVQTAAGRWDGEIVKPALRAAGGVLRRPEPWSQ